MSDREPQSPQMRLFIAAPGVPGPRRWPAALHAFRYAFVDPIVPALELRPRGGAGVVGVARDSGDMVLAYGSDLVREVLTNRDVWLRPAGSLVRLPADRSHLQSLLDTLLFMNGETWRARRRVLTPPTSKAELIAAMAPTFAQTVREIAGAWSTGSDVDLAAETMRITLRNNVRCLLGLEPAEGEPLAGLMGRFTSGVASPTVIVSQLLGPRARKTPYVKWLDAGEGVCKALVPLIASKRAKPSSDALGALVRSVAEDTGRPLDDEQLMGELTAFFAAGYETTARTLGWTLWLLGHHPDIARSVAAEVADVCGQREPTLQHVARMQRLNDVVQEAQRVLTVVPTSLPRANVKEATLGGITLPPGTNVMVPFVAMHHDPAVFPNPGRFDPSRWPGLRERGDALTYQFMPFGAGPRRCLGGVFADHQLRCTLAALLQRYSFIPRPEPVDYRVTTATMGPRGPLRMRVEAPDRWRATPPASGTITRLLRS